VSEAVASDEDTSAYVAELEQRADVLEDEEDLPSGDSLAAELTRFLREREAGNGGPEQGAVGAAVRLTYSATEPYCSSRTRSSRKSGGYRPRPG
jgi:hypothetical protein